MESFSLYKSPFRTSELPQPEALTTHLTQLLQSDAYNRYCVDCLTALSTHAVVPFGIFVCQRCATRHLVAAGGTVPRGGVKCVLTEWWDDAQLRCLELGGNQRFFEHLQEYAPVRAVGVERRYQSEGVKWYQRRLQTLVDGVQQFQERPPAKDWEEKA